MGKPRLDVILSNHSLFIDGEKIELDHTFCYAKSFRDNAGNVDVLELRYPTSDPYLVVEQAEAVYAALEGRGLEEDIVVSPCPENPGEDYLAVGLYGDFKATVYD